MQTPALASHPAPTGNGTDIPSLVAKDIEARAAEGEKHYGTRLRANNGRKSLVDLYQELLDAVVYIRQFLEEHPEHAYTES